MSKTLTNYCEILNNTIIGMTVPIFKPEGWTSFDVVKKLRNISRFKKVGHAGTLDPFASGLLILGFGKHTKKLDEVKAQTKEYIVDLKLGIITDTYDRTGKIIRETVSDEIDLNSIHSVLKMFTGDIQQLPPMYSAKRVNGKHLYQYARKGVEVERKETSVTISDISLLDYTHPIIRLNVTCSTGTYIRSLAYDIGESLGVGAMADTLIRTKIGDYSSENAFTIEEFTEAWKLLAA